MPVSNHSRPSSSKKSTSKSNHNPATPETAITPAEAPSSLAPIAVVPTPPVTAAPVPSTSNSTLASEAMAQLDALEAKLNLDIVVRPNDKAQIRALKRVSDNALSLASDIVDSSPTELAAFSGIPAARDYAIAMSPVATRAALLATHLQKSIANKRTPAAQKTLALYAVVKGLGRIVTNETMRETVPLLKAEVAPKVKSPKRKETKEEKAAKRSAKSTAERDTKATAVLAAANGAPPPTSGSSSPASAPAATAPAAAAPATATPSH